MLPFVPVIAPVFVIAAPTESAVKSISSAFLDIKKLASTLGIGTESIHL